MDFSDFSSKLPVASMSIGKRNGIFADCCVRRSRQCVHISWSHDVVSDLILSPSLRSNVQDGSDNLFYDNGAIYTEALEVLRDRRYLAE